MPKKPDFCYSNHDCIETETCYMGSCVNPCQINEICPKNATCTPKLHRAECTCKNGDISTNCTSYTLCKSLIYTTYDLISFISNTISQKLLTHSLSWQFPINFLLIYFLVSLHF